MEQPQRRASRDDVIEPPERPIERGLAGPEFLADTGVLVQSEA